MKKLLLFVLIIPLFSFSQKLTEDIIEPFKKNINQWHHMVSTKSFFKGFWINETGMMKLAETTFGTPVFNSGPHSKEHFNNNCKDFGHYDPLFLDLVIESVKSLSPSLKTLVQPLYDSYFKMPLRRLMQNKVSDYFVGNSNKNFLDQIHNKDDHNSLLKEIKSTYPNLSC